MSPTRQEIEAADRVLLSALEDLVRARGLFCESSVRYRAHQAAQTWTGMQARIPPEDRAPMKVVKASASGNAGVPA